MGARNNFGKFENFLEKSEFHYFSSIPKKVPEGHIALIVLDSQIIPAHLLRVVLSFIYTNELSDLDESDTQTNCQLASDSELSKDSVI